MQSRDELARCGRTLADKGLVWGHSGNISVRTGAAEFLISAGGTDLGSLGDGDLVQCQVGSDEWEGQRRPSMEAGLHRGIYRSRPDAAAVIHSQPPYTTLIACSDIEVSTDFLPEAMVYLGTVGRVAYHHAGSRELAESTAAEAANSQALLLANHGTVCWGASLDEALIKTETLEFICRLLTLARAGGIELNHLGEAAARDFIKHLRAIGRLD